MNSKHQLYSFQYIIMILVIFSLVQCKTHYPVENVEYHQNQSISEDLDEDSYVNSFIEPYKDQIDERLNEIIAVASVDLTDEGLSSNLGNLLADITLNGANNYADLKNLPPVDIAVLNHGGMRVDIGKGDVTVKKVYEMMPFENVLVLVTLTGAQLQGLIDYMLQSKKGHPLAGIVLEYKDGNIQEALVNREKIDPNRKYVIATNNYLFNGGDKMDFFKSNVQVTETELKIRDIFINGFREMKNLPNLTDERLIIK